MAVLKDIYKLVKWFTLVLIGIFILFAILMAFVNWELPNFYVNTFSNDERCVIFIVALLLTAMFSPFILDAIENDD